jgi:hypothetical protein
MLNGTQHNWRPKPPPRTKQGALQMTNPDLTLIGVLVDRSGSMHRLKSDMEPALASFLTSQAEQPGTAQVSLAHFDDVYEQVWALRDITEVPSYTLVPRNTTALLDAMGRFVTDVGAELAARPEQDRPAKVIIVIITDGMENASREWSRDGVRELVQRQREGYAWEFVFLGANFDAVAEAGRLGIPQSAALTFAPEASPAAMASMGSHVSRLRAAGQSAFGAVDRSNAMTTPSRRNWRSFGRSGR